MYFNSKVLLLSLVLPSVLVLSSSSSSSSPIATTSAAGSSDDTVLAHIQSIPEVLLSNSHREKLIQFRDAFVQWKKQHFRVYDFVEVEVKKMLTWVENHEFIERHNNQKPLPSFTLSHNQFSDMTNDEFQRLHSLGKYSLGKEVVQEKMAKLAAMKKMQEREHPAQAEFRYLRELSLTMFDDLFSDDEAVTDDATTDDDKAEPDDDATNTDDHDTSGFPDEVDWVTAGAVTPVKNQGSCGSCWAFSAVGAIEGAHYLATGELVSLSEQNLMDCDPLDHSCEGGLMENAFQFEESQNGLCTEEEYPYLAIDTSVCSTNCTKVAHTKVKDYIDIPQGDKHGLIASIVMQPTSIAMDAGSLSFQFYSKGVFDDDGCGANGEIDHGVLAVGYGTDNETGHKYFKVKNSWGEDWGEGGYFRIKRHSKNEFGTCAVLAYMTAPIVD